MKPILNPISKPEGRAGEYWEYVLNIYTTCNHACTYCYARAMYERWHGKGSFSADPVIRSGLIEGLKKQLSKGEIVGKLIGLCDMCDPYPAGVDTSATREIIKLLKDSGNHVQILTKSGEQSAVRDFDLLDENDWFGITYAGYPQGTLFANQESEPNADPVVERLAALAIAHKQGIKTWISMEPVLDDVDVLNFLTLNPYYVDRYKIGKLNYHPSSIDWKAFGLRAESICKSEKMDYYIKDSLRKEMEA